MSKDFKGKCNLAVAQRLPGKTIEPETRVTTDVSFKRTVVELPLERCGFETTDPDEFEAHIKAVHGRSPRPTKRIPRWRAPKPKDDAEAREAITARLDSITWVEDGETCTGQYWCDAPKGSIWVIQPNPQGNAQLVCLTRKDNAWQRTGAWQRPASRNGLAFWPERTAS